ncbi:hypothetical protein [Mycolicibacterium sp. XJ1819]
MAVDVDADRRGVTTIDDTKHIAPPQTSEDADQTISDNDDAIDAAAAARRRAPTKRAFGFGSVLILALTCLVGWQGIQFHQTSRHQAQRNLFLESARQTAVNLTTIDWRQADTDVQRITDGATGTFYDDFSERSQPFIQVVKQAQSQSKGTVTEAGIESDNGDQANVLVAVTVKTTTPASPDDPPRAWRMRLSVQRVGDSMKVSNVEFVP